MERLLEWQRDLAEKLGVAIQELQEVPLPSEEELDRLKDHLENKFEHTVMTSLSVDFKVTDFNMDRLAKLRQELHERYELTNNRVRLLFHCTGSVLDTLC
ncbi:Cobaltochelatase CobN subunit [Operophtera brumata]|uniref:Cobaltochelatase CobN subunit n=1 Tax=Operophtera brumata TaxID=104452 RepID=A0A0L7LIU6_OPEBR|nr:Cobaltochelatase CobN subunit [Operophtera brumata]